MFRGVCMPVANYSPVLDRLGADTLWHSSWGVVVVWRERWFELILGSTDEALCGSPIAGCLPGLRYLVLVPAADRLKS